MKYFVVITLMICVIGVSSVFATGQTKAATSNLVITAQTVQTMVKNTVKYVKYVVPIESMIVVVSFLLSMVFRPFAVISFITIIVMFIPLMLLLSIF